jgi:hypothetical protein
MKITFVLNMEKKENYLSDRSLNFLKIAAFLVVKGVNYSFNSKNPFTDIPQLDHNKSNKIREFVSKLLTHNRNETPRILSFSTDPKNIHQEEKETVKKAISETYCTLYCDNKYFSEGNENVLIAEEYHSHNTQRLKELELINLLGSIGYK